MTNRTSLALVALSLVTAGCGETVRRFPLRDPMWVDDDQKPHEAWHVANPLPAGYVQNQG